MKNKASLTLTILALAIILLAGCQTPAGAPLATKTSAIPQASPLPEKSPQPGTPTQTGQANQVGLPNPASQNCTVQGGNFSIEQRGDGGQFGVCTFEDNQQCEEWALLRGDCPVGGIKVTGYVTPAARYCAITGGSYAVTGESNTANEQGTCTFKNAVQCDAWEYYNGKCSGN